jgi:succinylglutamic semialdehyde dehydrogenase
MAGQLYINGEWKEGRGEVFASFNPADYERIWEGNAASGGDIDDILEAARVAHEDWALRPLSQRIKYLQQFQSVIESRREALAVALAQETGKVLWDARTEITAMIGKLAFSLKGQEERAGEKMGEGQGFRTALRHRPHGVVAVYGPYNFPLHLPNGHIMPALLAGNCVIFKPSELTPLTAEKMMECWHEAGLPPGVINLAQGERETGRLLASHPALDGLFFTGSSDTGKILSRQFAETPGKILALELGGNNPLIVHGVSDIRAAVYWTVMSAFQTSGQRCTCARRLIVPQGNDAYIEALIAAVARIKVGAYNDVPEPYMGPLISNREAEKLLAAQGEFIKSGGKALVEMKRLREGLPFVSPALIDVTAIEDRPDREWFGPLLQLIRVPDIDKAIIEANSTQYGLSSGIFTDSREHYEEFLLRARAGVVNWNRPLTGSSGNLPFGGLGLSGNHRPAAYYAADYCAYPVASNEADKLVIPAQPSPGLTL